MFRLNIQNKTFFSKIFIAMHTNDDLLLDVRQRSAFQPCGFVLFALNFETDL